MRPFAEIGIRWRHASLLAAAPLLAACAGQGAGAPTHLDLQVARGFTITDDARVGSGVRADFANAVRLLEQQRHQDGIAVLLTVTEAAPDATSAHIDLAMAYGQVGELDKAEASLERALALNPRHPVALNELGILYRRTGRFREARASYEKALSLYPQFHYASRNLGILCDLYLADRACALEHYERYGLAVPDDEAVAIWIRDLRSRGER